MGATLYWEKRHPKTYFGSGSNLLEVLKELDLFDVWLTYDDLKTLEVLKVARSEYSSEISDLIEAIEKYESIKLSAEY